MLEQLAFVIVICFGLTMQLLLVQMLITGKNDAPTSYTTQTLPTSGRRHSSSKSMTEGGLKAVIHYLSHSKRIENLKRSISSFDVNFNRKYNYPILIFYEVSDTAFNESEILEITKSPVLFQRIGFQIPSFVNQSRIPIHGCLHKFSLGYRHMCRFHAVSIYKLPIMRRFQYALRLDDDSVLLRPIEYDIFQFMERNDLKYGYIRETNDHPLCTIGLWEATDDYIRRRSLTTQFYSEWPKYRIFYNNFEVSALSLWNSAAYRKFVKYVDRLGGIYYYRWGDAPIKSVAVSMFVSRNQTHQFDDVEYLHTQG